jgi:hypothetical protein
MGPAGSRGRTLVVHTLQNERLGVVYQSNLDLLYRLIEAFPAYYYGRALYELLKH